jgi:NAD(P)-dependent dehydrogenase (short-subunit alcohol dehydrogenase family)
MRGRTCRPRPEADGRLFSLEEKVALLTGASRGIGVAIATEMARAGAQVVLSSNETAACGEVAAQLRAQGLNAAIGLPCDVMQRQQIEDLVRQTLALRQRIDVLVCNAGVAPLFGPIALASDADWDCTMTINLRSAVWITSLVIPGMVARRDASIILTASLSSMRGNKTIGPYGRSKAALAQLARNLAVEWGPANVRVNSISPGAHGHRICPAAAR